jgi:DNA-binding transcriptional regulator YiaG
MGNNFLANRPVMWERPRMKLLAYMRERAITNQQFAEILGGDATHSKVKKWKYGESKPSLEDVARIQVVTEGSVRLEDFIETPDTEAAE